MVDFIETETLELLKPLMGGIKVSEEEKENNLNKIKNAILNNNSQDKLIKINNETFAKSYPESMQLVKAYYDSVYNNKIANIVGWDGKTYINRPRRIAYYRAQINKSKLETILIFTPQLIDKEVLDIKSELGITSKEVAYIFKIYKKMINQNNVSNALENNPIQEGYYLKDQIVKMGNYCQNKIPVNTPNGVIKMTFTILDYYTLIHNSPITTLDFIENSKLFSCNTKEENICKNIVKKMLREYRSTEIYISKEQILKNRMAAGTVGHIVEMNEEICDEIFALLDEAKIPKSQEVVEKAFQRYALNQPILPIKLIEEEEKLAKETAHKLIKKQTK